MAGTAAFLGQPLSRAYLSSTPGEGAHRDLEAKACVGLLNHTKLFPLGLSTAFCLCSKVGRWIPFARRLMLAFDLLQSQGPESLAENVSLIWKKRTLNSTCLFSF